MQALAAAQAPAAAPAAAQPAHPPVTQNEPWRKCYIRAVGRDGPGGIGCAMCLSRTEHGDPFCWKQAHLSRQGETAQRATYHAVILALAAALQQGFSEVFFMGYNEIVTKQVRLAWLCYPCLVCVLLCASSPHGFLRGGRQCSAVAHALHPS